MAYWSRLVAGKCARFVKFKNITVCIEANKYLLLLLLIFFSKKTKVILATGFFLILEFQNFPSIYPFLS